MVEKLVEIKCLGSKSAIAPLAERGRYASVGLAWDEVIL